jgi:hypothetical protein
MRSLSVVIVTYGFNYYKISNNAQTYFKYSFELCQYMFKRTMRCVREEKTCVISHYRNLLFFYNFVIDISL